MIDKCTSHSNTLKDACHKSRHGVLEKDIALFVDMVPRVLMEYEGDHELDFPYVDADDPRTRLAIRIKPLLCIPGMYRALQIAMLRLITERMDMQRMYPLHTDDQSPLLLFMIGVQELPWHKAHGRALMHTIYARHALDNRYIPMDSVTINRALRKCDGYEHDIGSVAGVHHGAAHRLNEPTDTQKKVLCTDATLNVDLMQSNIHLLDRNYVDRYIRDHLLDKSHYTYVYQELMTKILFMLPSDYLSNSTCTALITGYRALNMPLKRHILRIVPHRIDTQLWDCIKEHFFPPVSGLTHQAVRAFILSHPYFINGHVRDIAGTGDRSLIDAMFNNLEIAWTKGMVVAVLSVVKGKSRYIQDITISAFVRMQFIDKRFQSDDGSQELWAMDDYTDIVSDAEPKYRRTHMAFVRDDVVYDDATTDTSQDETVQQNTHVEKPDKHTERTSDGQPHVDDSKAPPVKIITCDKDYKAGDDRWSISAEKASKKLFPFGGVLPDYSVGDVPNDAGRNAYYRKLVENFRDSLNDEFPNFKAVTQSLAGQVLALTLARRPLRFHPMVLLGDAGIGKTTYVYAFCEKLSLYCKRIDMGGVSAGFVLAGSAGTWRDAQPGMVAKAFLSNDSCVANPVLILDEIDKGRGDIGSPVYPALLSMLEKTTAKSFQDEFLRDAYIDLTYATFIMTANGVAYLPDSIQSRVIIFDVPSPTKSEKRVIAERMYEIKKQELMMTDHYAEHLCPDILDTLCSKSLREVDRLLSLAMTNALMRIDDEHNVTISEEDLEMGHTEKRMGFL